MSIVAGKPADWTPERPHPPNPPKFENLLEKKAVKLKLLKRLSKSRLKSNKYFVINYENSQFSIEILMRKSQNYLSYL